MNMVCRYVCSTLLILCSVGEVIDVEESKQRLNGMYEREQHKYLMNLVDRFIVGTCAFVLRLFLWCVPQCSF